MFGYVKVNSAELKVKEYEFYKSVYCGLCRSLGKVSGTLSRLSLSYDLVFCALVRLGIGNDNICFSKKNCCLKGCKKVSLDNCPTLEYCAGAEVLLAYYKLLDDKNDTKGIGKIKYSLVLPIFTRIKKNTVKKLGLEALEDDISRLMEKLEEIEAKADFSADEAAEVFGEILSSVASFGIEDNKNVRILHELGLHIGRWIYFADAADDFEKDKKTGSKNAFVYEAKLKYDGKFDNELKNRIKTSLDYELSATERATALLDFKDSGIENIVNNIIYYGMPETAEKIFKTAEKEKTDE